MTIAAPGIGHNQPPPTPPQAAFEMPFIEWIVDLLASEMTAAEKVVTLAAVILQTASNDTLAQACRVDRRTVMRSKGKPARDGWLAVLPATEKGRGYVQQFRPLHPQNGPVSFSDYDAQKGGRLVSLFLKGGENETLSVTEGGQNAPHNGSDEGQNAPVQGEKGGKNETLSVQKGGENVPLSCPEEGQIAPDLKEKSPHTPLKENTTTLSNALAGATTLQIAEGLRGRLLEMGAGVLSEVSAPALLGCAEIVAWIENGADPERDIVPAVRDAVAKKRGAQGRQYIRGWGYFTPMVADAVQRRLKGFAAHAGASNGAIAADGLTERQRQMRAISGSA